MPCMPVVLSTQQGSSQPRPLGATALFGKHPVTIIGHGQFVGGVQYYKIKLVACGTERPGIREDLLK